MILSDNEDANRVERDRYECGSLSPKDAMRDLVARGDAKFVRGSGNDLENAAYGSSRWYEAVRHWHSVFSDR